MQVELILPDTDLERFQEWMDQRAMLLENAINDPWNWCKVVPVLFGWERQKFRCYYEFCAVTPTPKQIEDERLMWSGRTSDEDMIWVSAANNERFNAVEERNRYLYDGKQRWLYLPKKDDRRQHRDEDKIVSAWVSAQEYRRGQLRVTFWRDDAQPGYDVLLDMLRKDFGIETSPDAPTPQAGAVNRPNLTDRQTQVATLRARGLQNKEVATALNINESTVKTHVRSIKEAIEATGRSVPDGQLVLVLRELGYGDHPQG